MYLAVAGLEIACRVLDAVPRHEGGRWYRYGDWGCQLGLSRLSARLEERWRTGYWRVSK